MSIEADPMISKCANPGCSARLLYLRSGKVIRLDLESPGPDAGPSGRSTGPARCARFFWLCADCSARVSVKLVDGRVTVQALDDRDRLSGVA